MGAGDPVEKDILVRKLFLNLEIDNQKRVTFRWREPFNIVSDQCNSSKNASGGRSGNRTHTPLRELDFESGASTNSAIRPDGYILS